MSTLSTKKELKPMDFNNSGKFYQKTRWIYDFLDRRSQPTSIKDYLFRENKFLFANIKKKSTIIDFGCGYGRHLRLLSSNIKMGVGIDVDKRIIFESRKYLSNCKNVITFTEDGVQTNFETSYFDYAICMTNTFGNLNNKKIPVLLEMKRVVNDNAQIIISVHSPKSIQDKIQWYPKTGLEIVRFDKRYIYTNKGLKSEHFTKGSLKALFNKVKLKSKIIDLSPISYICILSRV